jgi:hypothetical protein
MMAHQGPGYVIQFRMAELSIKCSLPISAYGAALSAKLKDDGILRHDIASRNVGIQMVRHGTHPILLHYLQGTPKTFCNKTENNLLQDGRT